MPRSPLLPLLLPFGTACQAVQYVTACVSKILNKVQVHGAHAWGLCPAMTDGLWCSTVQLTLTCGTLSSHRKRIRYSSCNWSRHPC